MKIAETYVNGQISHHFGYTEQSKINTAYNVKNKNSKVVDTNRGSC